MFIAFFVVVFLLFLLGLRGVVAGMRRVWPEGGRGSYMAGLAVAIPSLLLVALTSYIVASLVVADRLD